MNEDTQPIEFRCQREGWICAGHAGYNGKFCDDTQDYNEFSKSLLDPEPPGVAVTLAVAFAIVCFLVALIWGAVQLARWLG